MVIIVQNGEVTEQKKQKAYKYKGLFKLINNICNLIEELEEIDDSRTQTIESLQIDTAKEINNIIANIDYRR